MRVRRFVLMLMMCLALASSASARTIAWPAAETEGQRQLQAYMALVDENLTAQGQSTFNTLFECYATFACLGVTAQDNAEVPEQVELSISLYEDSINVLQLRVSDPARFAPLAASCIQAVSPSVMTLSDALASAQPYATKAQSAPLNSFEEPVDEMNGNAPRAYYAYYPNQYQDNVNWLQLTLIFPMAGSCDAALYTLPSATAAPAASDEYEGYNPEDSYPHLEVFLQETPEPDSPAGEQQ